MLTVRPRAVAKLRIVVKIGTNVLSQVDGSIASHRIAQFSGDISRILDEGHDVLIVTSGAVGLGRRELGLDSPKSNTPVGEKQACAAVGQTLLMRSYQEAFGKHGRKVAQILVTSDDLSRRQSYLNLRETLERLFTLKVVPVLNENDSVSVMELEDEKSAAHVFGDNDKLSALISAKVGADFLFLLTDVAGVFDFNPKSNAQAKKFSVIESLEVLDSISTLGKSSAGRGGMETKLAAAKAASLCGIPVLIDSGLRDGVIWELFSTRDEKQETRPGTLILPGHKLHGKKRWIGFSTVSQGCIKINEGATRALVDKQASLLPSGVTDVVGSFSRGDVVSIETSEGFEIARGIAEFSAPQIKKIAGRKSTEVKTLLGKNQKHPSSVVHRDRLVLLQAYALKKGSA